jgi:hypothetical protein
MEDEDMDKKLSDLSSKVTELSGSSEAGPMSSFTSGFSSSIVTKFSSPYVYFAAIPILVGIFLYFVKPGCIMEIKSVEGEHPKPVIQTKRFALLTIVLSVAIGAGIYIYCFRKKPDE